MSTTDRLLDGSAIGLSGLCLAHCLLLPVAAALLPVLGAWAEAEWVHGLFVVVAVPLSGLAMLPRANRQRRSGAVLCLAVCGLTLLLSGAFIAATEEAETTMTVAGSLCLAGAHLWNWLRRARAAEAGCAAGHRDGARPSPTGDL
ncbi:MerC domain-containing protein [Phenylobacterium sp.]|uniref:MerC domain-containing protein n=1 Tax=Phenylobacterium sp. TaxID=1871053 RepID=UPI0037CB8F5B